jgi:aldehyde dehydrogenase (NAD+)
MAMPQTITQTHHPYADGQFKRMLINGEWVRAASGKTFESRNPATGDLLATVAEGDAEDINRAVAAARAAFEGRWSKFKPYVSSRYRCIRTNISCLSTGRQSLSC